MLMHDKDLSVCLRREYTCTGATPGDTAHLHLEYLPVIALTYIASYVYQTTLTQVEVETTEVRCHWGQMYAKIGCMFGYIRIKFYVPISTRPQRVFNVVRLRYIGIRGARKPFEIICTQLCQCFIYVIIKKTESWPRNADLSPRPLPPSVREERSAAQDRALLACAALGPICRSYQPEVHCVPYFRSRQEL